METHTITSSTSTPSLFRIGLTAGFVSLAQKRDKGSRSFIGNSSKVSIASPSYGSSLSSSSSNHVEIDDGESSALATYDRTSLLSSPEEDAATMAIIEAAQGIAEDMKSHRADGTDEFVHHPITIEAALSAMGGGSSTQSSRGVLVNVIDPTTLNTKTSSNIGGVAVDAAAHENNSAQQMHHNNPDTPPPPSSKGLFAGFRSGGESNINSATNNKNTNTNTTNYKNIYNKLTSTFAHNYDSTLHSLPYTHPRTSTRCQIASLPVRFALTMQPASDPADWHMGPYCHIYIAAVENLEHYRAKVRPALRAFVNQIEGSGTMATASSGSGVNSGVHSSTGGNMGSTVASGAKQQPRPSSAGSSGGTGSSNDASPSKGGKSANEKALARAGLLAGKSVVAGNFGSRYIIVFVPVGGGGGAAAASSDAAAGVGGGNHGGSGGGGGGFGGFRAGRKGQTGGVVLTSPPGGVGGDSSQTVKTILPSQTTPDGDADRMDASHHSAAAAAALPPGPIAHSSKEVKELYQKFLKDFPNGRTVILGTLLDDDSTGASLGGVTSMSPLKNQEWKAFLHNLGSAIVDGFQDRVRRYDEELRRLDSERMTFVRKLSGESVSAFNNCTPQGKKPVGSNFDLSNFFLVKESLAFTYEQMQLFEEAKLQYEELTAFLPEDALRYLVRQQRRSLEEKDDDTSPLDLAIAGNSQGFRHHIKKSGKDLRGVSEFVPHYIFSREVRLLFRMGTSAVVDVLALSRDFLFRSYRIRLLEVSNEFRRRWTDEIERVVVDSSAEEILAKQSELRKERLKKEIEVEAQALSLSWDVKIASEHYLTFTTKDESQRGEEHQRHHIVANKDDATAAASTIDEVEAARCLAEMIEFATLRFLRLGDLFLEEQGEARENPVRQATCEHPLDTVKKWQPWQKLRKDQSEIMANQLRRSDDEKTWPAILPDIGLPSWLYRAMKTTSTYEESYLELTEAAVCFNCRGGRFRIASRIEDHRAEVLIVRGKFTAEARVLSKNVGACVHDQWARAHYWRIFRLACCQRMSGDVFAYLETLSQSFNPKLSSVAPKKTALLLQQDLEAIIADAAVSNQRWGAFSFLDTDVSFESNVTQVKSAQPLPFVRRNLTKHSFFVGDELKFSLNIRSNLPRPVTVNGIRLYVVTLEQYELVYRRNGIVTEDDAFRILTVGAHIQITPGQNTFSISWQPMTSNLFVLATVEVQWKEASFFYDSALLRKPIIGLEIQPSRPTQTIELNPLFLIPGHVQNVRLVIHSGSDIITEGLVRLVCSEGLLVVPPNTVPTDVNEAWSDECTIPLDACGPGNRIVITILVKSSPIKHDVDIAAIQTMWAKVETFYHHKLYQVVMENGEEPESDPMKTVLEAMVTTLDRPALTVRDTEAVMFGDNHVMVNILLQCNSPVPFYVKEWHLGLPPPLVVELDGDLSKGLFSHAIPEGEKLLFGFKCVLTDSSESTCVEPLLRIVLKDDFGKTFVQILPIDLDEIYNKLRKDSCTEVYTVSAELVCAVDEGTVGHPVPFVYTLNLLSLMTPRQRRCSIGTTSVCSVQSSPIQYTIISEGSEWIVSGKVKGLIKPSTGSDTMKLHFRAIPTKSGSLRDFPVLYLDYLPLNDSLTDLTPSTPIVVQCKKPEGFQSFAYTSSLSLAVPATTDEF